jgi:hypothetical protein
MRGAEIRRVERLVAGALTIASLSGVLSAKAQVPPQPDHLTCYSIVKDTNSPKEVKVRLVHPQFHDNQSCGITSTQATLLCAPTEKFSESNRQGDDPRGGPLNPNTDYLCYKLACGEVATRNLRVDDQFNNVANRVVQIKLDTFLCAPAKKRLLP